MYHPYFRWTSGAAVPVTGKSRVVASEVQKAANEKLRAWVTEQYVLQNKKREAEKQDVIVAQPVEKKPVRIKKKFVPEFIDEPIVQRVLVKPDVVSMDEILAPIKEQIHEMYKNAPVLRVKKKAKPKVEPHDVEEEVLMMLLLSL